MNCMSLETLVFQWLHSTFPGRQFSLWKSEIYCHGWTLLFVNNNNTVEVPPKYIPPSYPIPRCATISAIDPEFFDKLKPLVEVRINTIANNMSLFGV